MYLLYGLAKGDTERYMEILLCTVCKTLKDIDKVKRLAKSDGFYSFRVVKDKLEMPDFVGTINTGKKKRSRR